jgi:mono/diheme cytochrome c family protein
MKLRYTILFTLITIALTACNFTLAEDVTPPPNYVPPTPLADLGQLFPAQAPSVENGAAIYVEKCLPCHGETGLGDGEQGIQLGVTVRAFGLPEIARPASPAQYYTAVTRGNIERFMPPFASLNDQQRWDVVAYVLTMHTTSEQIEKGKGLFEANCADCPTDFFKDQEKMSTLSAVELARLIREGGEGVPAFGSDLSDDDLWAVAAYLRTLSFDTAPLVQLTTAPVSQTPVAADVTTPSAEGTPIGTEQAAASSEATPVVQDGFGTINGSIENKAGTELPSDLAISLHGYDHGGADPNAGAQEVFTQDGTVNADGTYAFENIELPVGRIFLVEATYGGITLQSEFGVVESGQISLTLPPLILYEITKNISTLVIDEVHMFVQSGSDGTYEVLALYNFRNSGETVIMVEMTEKQEIAFLKFPSGTTGLGYEAVQDSAPFISMDQGFALAPNEQQYSILAFSSIAKATKTIITQEFAVPAAVVRIFVPDGMEVKGDRITTDSSQDIQGTVYQSYLANDLQAGDALTFELTGAPKAASATETSAPARNTTLLIGAGGVGLVLILAGVWMYWRDRKRAYEASEEENDEEHDEEAEFESSDEVLDAIIALDDLHRTKKISESAYQKRRAELKEILKGVM